MKQYNKLVRDKIPEICVANGDIPKIRIIKDATEYLSALTDKLHEEAAEVKDDPSLEELADALEVIQSIGKAQGYTPDQIEAARAKKVKERGGFENRIFLVSTEPKE